MRLCLVTFKSNEELTSSEITDKIKTAKIAKYSDKQFVENDYSRKHDRSLGKLKDLVEQKYISAFAKGLVLDCGAGTGRFTIPLKHKGFKIIAVDASPAMLRHILKRNKEIPVAVTDIEYLPFSNNTFDTVVCMHVLFHMPQFKQILKEYLRVLRPEGVILFELQSGEHFEVCRVVAERLGFWKSVTSDVFFDYYNWIYRKDFKAFIETVSGVLLTSRSYDIFNTYWFVKTTFLLNFVSWILDYKIIMKTFYLFERKIIPYMHPFFSSRFFAVVKKQ